MTTGYLAPLFLGATAGWIAGLWMGSRPCRTPKGDYGLPPDHDWRRSYNHENTNRPSGPPPLQLRRSEPEERQGTPNPPPSEP